MRASAFAFALMLSGAAVAQTMADPPAEVDAYPQTTTTTTTTDTTTSEWGTTTTSAAMPAGSQIVQPSNADPELDAHGVKVISAAAVVPGGYNNTAGTGVGGPMVDPATGQTVSATSDTYPPCSRTVTDNCLQTYERGRAR